MHLLAQACSTNTREEEEQDQGFYIILTCLSPCLVEIKVKGDPTTQERLAPFLSAHETPQIC